MDTAGTSKTLIIDTATVNTQLATLRDGINTLKIGNLTSSATNTAITSRGTGTTGDSNTITVDTASLSNGTLVTDAVTTTVTKLYANNIYSTVMRSSTASVQVPLNSIRSFITLPVLHLEP